MSRAARKTKRRRMAAAKATGASIAEFYRLRLMSPEHPRSHAEFVLDVREKQAAGRLANPATAALLDRLERVIK